MSQDTASQPESGDLERLAAVRCDALTGVPSAPRTPDAWLFARLVAAREVRGELALLGLSRSQLEALGARHFVGAPSEGAQHALFVANAEHAAFAAAMHGFLVSLAAPQADPGDVRCLAAIIARACLRPDHLWRDLGLRGRDDVTRMLERFFPEVVARNAEGLRWKKLLARELAQATGAAPGPAPGCPGCEDFGFCFPAGR
ncbi:nitrogen fixation protein NifQ [Paraburkholderia lycopersici]|uniref:Nitrogen fixation protein NifQ n=1 Tax=Paraburkholderia lycopersici TaxID=416944 RepID=A0A1G6INV5_9BURK|nr:nitrogen fixation protein NifQ [Paraburkholderia lycopersici]SDC08091.1 nitrogen fixation protein NifQ [Paraburkholderia lycopersici]